MLMRVYRQSEVLCSDARHFFILNTRIKILIYYKINIEIELYVCYNPKWKISLIVKDEKDEETG